MTNKINIESILLCPVCKGELIFKKSWVKCLSCDNTFSKRAGVWNMLNLKGQKSKSSLRVYEQMHKNAYGRIKDGSYEILASFARGNKSLDVACGDGFIEMLAPETVGLEFSWEALKKAKKNGAKHLVLADAHHLPFKDSSFDIAICAGSLEHFENPLSALKEMARVSKIQVLTVHKSYPIPLANYLRSQVLKFKSIPDQPIDNPMSLSQLEKLFKRAKMNVVFKGVWTYPYDFGNLGFWVPKFFKLPSCHFFITKS